MITDNKLGVGLLIHAHKGPFPSSLKMITLERPSTWKMLKSDLSCPKQIAGDTFDSFGPVGRFCKPGIHICSCFSFFNKWRICFPATLSLVLCVNEKHQCGQNSGQQDSFSQRHQRWVALWMKYKEAQNCIFPSERVGGVCFTEF